LLYECLILHLIANGTRLNALKQGS